MMSNVIGRVRNNAVRALRDMFPSLLFGLVAGWVCWYNGWLFAS